DRDQPGRRAPAARSPAAAARGGVALRGAARADHRRGAVVSTSMTSPFTQPQLIGAFQVAESEVAAFFGSLSPEEFVLREGNAWNPAEHLAHVNTALSAVARGFGIRRWILRLRFGRAKPSRRFEELVDDYNARLRAGAGATGRFVPPEEELTGDEGVRRQQELLERWQRVNARMRTALAGWSDRD